MMNQRVFILVFLLIGILPCQQVSAESWPDPERFRSAITAFSEQDHRKAPAEGAVLGVGSSSMRYWATDGLFDAHFSPLTVINRGFGGSVMNDVAYFLEETVLRYQPRAVLLYEGDNDVSRGIPLRSILASLELIIERIHTQDASIRIYLLSVKPSLARWPLWPLIQSVNHAFEQRAMVDSRITFIDVGRNMLNAEGEPKPEIFVGDGLHLNAAGYALWHESVTSVVVPVEQAFEATVLP